MTYESFIIWLRKRRETESLRAIGDDLGVSAMSVLRYSREVKQPWPMVLRIASLLEQLPSHVTADLPHKAKPKRERRRRI